MDTVDTKTDYAGACHWEISRQTIPAVSMSVGRNPDATDSCSPELIQDSKLLLICLPGTAADAGFRSYGEYLSGLLQAKSTYSIVRAGGDLPRISKAVSKFGLVLYGQPEQSVLERILFGPIGRRLATNAPSTILIAQQPRWPIQKILLVLRIEASEKLAVDWAGYLTHLCDARLTILPLIPLQPLIYGTLSLYQVGIESILSSSTPSGEQLRSYLNRLNKWLVNGRLLIRHGDPLWQICWEITEGDYDLVIMGAEPSSRLRRWLFGELVGPLLSRMSRPLLIASRSQSKTPSLTTENAASEDKHGR